MSGGSGQSRTYKLLGIRRIAEALRPLADSGAEWFMSAECLVPRSAAVPVLRLVAWQAGHKLGSWPIHAMAYGSLVSQLVDEAAGPFVIPHARGFTYDEYAEVSTRLTEAKRVLAELIPPYNALLHRMSRTERTAGLSANQSRDWLTRAEQTLAATRGRELRQLIREVGPPRYAMHSGCLSGALPAVQRSTQRLKEFLATSLPPASPAEAGELATPGAEESKWDWVELALYGRGTSFGQDQQKYAYLPEIEIREAPFSFAEAEAETRLHTAPLPTRNQLPAESLVRTQLLEIRQQIDNLLASLD